MHRLVLFGVLGLGVLAPSVQADQQPDYFDHCLVEFAVAELALVAEQEALIEIIDAIPDELEAVLIELEAEERYIEAGWAIAEAGMLELLYIDALRYVGDARVDLLFAQANWVQMVAMANQLDVGHPLQYYPGGTRVSFASLGLRTQNGIQNAHDAIIAAGDMERTARLLINYLDDLEEDADDILDANQDSLDALTDYWSCVGPQAGRIVGIVTANVHARTSMGPNGVVLLRTHPSFGGRDVTLDLSNSDRSESEGAVSRSLYVGFEIPADAVFGNFVLGSRGEVLAHPGNPLAVKSTHEDTIPSYGMNAGVFESRGNPLTLNTEIPGLLLGAACAGNHPDLLLAGQSDACPAALGTTGTPQQIANGEQASDAFHVLSLGGDLEESFGSRYMRFRLVLHANYEAPTDPCYTWDPAANAYVFDQFGLGCGFGGDGNGGGGGPGGGMTALVPIPDPISTPISPNRTKITPTQAAASTD